MILTIACSACSTSFPVDPRKVPDEGVYARCSACEEVFFVDAAMPAASPTPPVALEEEAISVASDAGDDDSAPEPDGGSEQTDDWVFEVEPERDTSAPDMERLDTVEEGLRTAREESPWLTESISPTGAEEAPPEEQPDSVEEVVKECGSESLVLRAEQPPRGRGVTTRGGTCSRTRHRSPPAPTSAVASSPSSSVTGSSSSATGGPCRGHYPLAAATRTRRRPVWPGSSYRI